MRNLPIKLLSIFLDFFIHSFDNNSSYLSFLPDRNAFDVFKKKIEDSLVTKQLF